eukprot:2693936-Pyramimonas_sp.AAC.1
MAAILFRRSVALEQIQKRRSSPPVVTNRQHDNPSSEGAHQISACRLCNKEWLISVVHRCLTSVT